MPKQPDRLVPRYRFPAYSYVTGKFPHPTGDPDGHSFNKRERIVARFDPRQWQRCESYLIGIDLFNHGYYWESHEIWEAVWNSLDRKGTAADFVKGLIKLSAAGVKAREGRAEGVRRHAARAEELFRQTVESIPTIVGDTSTDYAGFDVSELIKHCRTLTKEADELINTSDDPVVIAVPFSLNPNPWK